MEYQAQLPQMVALLLVYVEPAQGSGVQNAWMLMEI
jgi:hypothetical protein